MSDAASTDLLWLAGKAFLICLVATPIVRDIFRSYDVVDQPGERKIHVYPVPRVGGIGIVIAYAFTLLPLPGLQSDSLAWRILPGTSGMFLTGLIDDFFTLRPRVKLLGQIFASVMVIWAGVTIESIAGFAIHPAIGAILSLGWLLLCTNALNLIDGLDGLCAGMALVACLALFAAGLLHDNAPLMLATLPLAGAILGFLCFNVHPATVFLGDSGALTLGFLLGCYGLIWSEKAATALSLALPLLVITIPLLDVSLSIVRRFISNRPIFSADRGHIHHRLLDRGLTPGRAALILFCAAAVPAAFALLLSSPGTTGRSSGMFLVVLCALIWLGIQRLRYPEFIQAGRLLTDGRFRKILGGHLELKALAGALASAASDEERWSALTNAARSYGFRRISWTGIHGTREEVLAEGNGHCWSIGIPLREGERIDLARPVQGNDAPVDLASFAELVHRALTDRPTAVRS